MFDQIYKESQQRAKHKIWILSDLQQHDPAIARDCLNAGISDFEKMGSPADMIWYLGDALQGDEPEPMNEICQMEEEAFVKTGLPLCYVAGNHDLDLIRSERGGPIAFYEMVRRHPNWYCAATQSDPYYTVRLGDFKVYFFTDHIAQDRSWLTTHGTIYGDAEKYPHRALLQNIKKEMEQDNCPIITASHYAFAGGCRASDLYSENVLPFPQNVRIHFFGHAHIGDRLGCPGEGLYQRISWIEWHDIPQINISSFEHRRGLTVRSVFLHIYEDHSMGVFFRDHEAGKFTECYFPSKTNYPYGKKS